MPGRLVDDAGHLERRLAVHEPGAERGAVAEIVEQAAAAARLAGTTRRSASALDLLGRDLDLVGEVVERPAVAVVEVHLDQLADRALVDQPLGGVVRRIPGERPVDREPPAGPSIAAIIRRASAALAANGFSTMHVEPVRRDPLDRVGVLGRRRADDGEVGPGRRQAGLEVGEDPVLGDAERRRSPLPSARGPGRRCRRSPRRDARRPGAAGRPCACGRS